MGRTAICRGHVSSETEAVQMAASDNSKGWIGVYRDSGFVIKEAHV